MSRYDFEIPVTFRHQIVFTRDAFSPKNDALVDILMEGRGRKVCVCVEDRVAQNHPDLACRIQTYFGRTSLDCKGVQIVPGGESVKADDTLVRNIWHFIDAVHLDRHSYLIAIGGGAFLDAVGFAAATAHRGVRLVRFPTTTLSQDDSGVGVKCAINAFGKKNWVGAFSVPFAVINDFDFLNTLDPQISRSGLVEAVKVALVKDPEFFVWIEEHLEQLATLEPVAVEKCVERSALLHAQHITQGGDPFEMGSSRPLDFGHWAAHKLEALTNHRLPHAEAVAIGIAVDTIYSERIGLGSQDLVQRVLRGLKGLQMNIYHPALDWRDEVGNRLVIEGLDEFREHLGGELTVLMLRDVGMCVDIHHFNVDQLNRSMDELKLLGVD